MVALPTRQQLTTKEIMAYNYMENISYRGDKANFERDTVKTIAELLAVDPADKIYDFGHIVFCEEDGKHYKYIYDYSNPPATEKKSVQTGWFSEFCKLDRIEQILFPLVVNLEIPELIKYTGECKKATISWTTKIDNKDITPTKITLKVEDTFIDLPNNISSYLLTISNTTDVVLFVEANDRVSMAVEKIRFAYPAYKGIVPNDFEITENNIVSLTELPLNPSKCNECKYDKYSVEKILYAYAAEYGDLTKIIGPMGGDHLYMFEKRQTTINNILYNVYLYKESGSTEGEITYLFQ